MFYISSKRLLLCVLVDLKAFTFFDIQNSTVTVVIRRYP